MNIDRTVTFEEASAAFERGEMLEPAAHQHGYCHAPSFSSRLKPRNSSLIGTKEFGIDVYADGTPAPAGVRLLQLVELTPARASDGTRVGTNARVINEKEYRYSF